MKKLLLMAFAAFMTVGASAQLISSNTVTHKEGKNYNRLNVSYNAISTDEYMTDGMTGFSLSWTKGISISSSTPLFIETGLGVTYAFKSDDYWDEDGYDATIDINHKYVGLTIPVNLVYKWNIPNTDMSLAPYVGLYLRGNLYGNTKYEVEDYDEDYSWFDDRDEGGMEAARLNWGWNIGVGLEYNKLYVGVSYSSDLNEIVEKLDKIGMFSATLGFKF